MQTIPVFYDGASHFLHLLLLHFRQVVHLILKELVLKGEVAVLLSVEVEDVYPSLHRRASGEQLGDINLIASEGRRIGHVK